MDFSVLSGRETREKRIEASWGSLQWLASKEMGNANGLTLGHVIIKKGDSNPRHYHQSEEVLYLLRGKLEHTAGDQKVILEAGDTISIPEGVPHNALNIGDEDAEMIVAFSTGTRDFHLESPPSEQDGVVHG